VQLPLSKRLAAEVIGTFGFFFIGFCGIAAATTQPAGAIISLGIAAGFGFGLGLMIFAFGHVSGGHYNPAVTLGLSAAKRFPAGEIAPYWCAQLIGGLGASLVLRLLFSHAILHHTLTLPAAGISKGQALGLEIVLTFLFLLVVTTVATDKRAPWSGVFAPFAIGLFIFTAATVAGPMSGGSFNPARSLTPAIIDGHFTDQWIYIAGPLIGGLIGGLVHAMFEEPERRPESGTQVSTP
jgi:aquaporin Z